MMHTRNTAPPPGQVHATNVSLIADAAQRLSSIIRLLSAFVAVFALLLGGCAEGKLSTEGGPTGGTDEPHTPPPTGPLLPQSPGGDVYDEGDSSQDQNVPGDSDGMDSDDWLVPDEVDDGADGPGPDASPQEPPPVVCGPIINGLSSVTVNGTTRLFSVRLPADTSQMALLFLWHGFLQIPEIFANEIVYDVPTRRWVPFDPNAFPMPLMIVAPYDQKILPPFGLDWDIVSGDLDVPFFDAMLGCIYEQFNIDDSRIYSFGFSAGAVFSNLLASIYPQLFAATISESGAWFNDPAEWADVLVPIIQWQWPPLHRADGGNVLLTHGGPSDFATVISLESANHKAMRFLYEHGRTVTECAHGFGHTLDPDLTQSMYYEWMWAHRRGGPPLPGLLPSFPIATRMVGSTYCTFHPAP